ncbi:hypothetical protein V6Z11_D03G167400 [Gossypium hirsutum]
MGPWGGSDPDSDEGDTSALAPYDVTESPVP